MIPLITSAIVQLKLSLSRKFFIFSLFVVPIIQGIVLYYIFEYQELDPSRYLIINLGLMQLWGTLVSSTLNDMNREKYMGTLISIFVVPSSLMIIIIGKSLSNLFLGIISYVYTIGILHYIFGIVIEIRNPIILFFSVCIIVTSYTMISVFLSLLILIDRKSASLMNVMEYPIYVISGFALPVEEFPLFFQGISYIFPTTWSLKLIHQIQEGSLDYLFSLMIVVLLSIFYFCLFLLVYKKIIQKIMISGEMEIY